MRLLAVLLILCVAVVTAACGDGGEAPSSADERSRAVQSPTSAASVAERPSRAETPRSFPDTTEGIHVFNDQLINLNPQLIAFAAAHYDGTQKMTRADADALRDVNPDLVILHYRLGLGLGYRQPDANCRPEGPWIEIIDEDWTREWPGDDVVQDGWFYEVDGQRVLHCGWGWYLMELDDPDWRSWWLDGVLSQLADNDSDGLFADSLSVPNYLGAAEYDPALPELDPAFEDEWTTRIEDFIAHVQERFAGQYYLIPNVGHWVTSRDVVDYSGADGVMIEGFGFDTWESYGETDWVLQLDRALGFVNLGKAVIAQSYSVDSADTRLFTLGSYLLIKGDRTYVNLDFGEDPEWWPEYDIPIGTPEEGPPADAEALLDADSGVYARSYSNGLVLVNAGDDPRTVTLDGTRYMAEPDGGGTVPSDGVLPATWSLDYSAVDEVTLEPGRAAILLLAPGPAGPVAEAMDTPAPHGPTATSAALPLPSATPLPSEAPPSAAEFHRVMFLHHSCGANLIEQGGVRERLTGLGYGFYDHGYNEDGLVLADGTWTGTNFDVPGDNTDPDGYADIFAQPLHDPPDNTFSHLMEYDVIAFKSCFPTSNILSDEQLADYKSYYLSIRDRMDEYPNKIFIVVTPPPEIPNETDPTAAARARDWASWLASGEYLSGHPNVFTFNFFDLLADPSDNMLRAEYRTDEWDAHPNEQANQNIGPQFADSIDQAVRAYAAQ